MSETVRDLRSFFAGPPLVEKSAKLWFFVIVDGTMATSFKMQFDFSAEDAGELSVRAGTTVYLKGASSRALRFVLKTVAHLASFFPFLSFPPSQTTQPAVQRKVGSL